jgi:HrpA-like RNA helicase
MSLPTLLKKNVIIPHMNEKIKDIQDITGIDYIMSWFNDRIENPKLIKTISDKIIILKSATGSGKSTVLPSEFYLRFYNKLKKNILVTQPRILTTISIPKDIASIDAYKYKNRTDNMGIELYKNIGYQTKEYIRKPLEKGILFCTIGVLLQFLKNLDNKQFISKYSCILIDEAHERTTNLDIIFYYMKELYNTYPIEECPFLIIASATLDVYKYAKYYNTKTIFEIIGTSFNIDTHYLKYDSQDVITQAIDTVYNIHTKNNNDDYSKSDIIIFIPSMSYILKLKNKILELNNKLDKKLFPIALDSANFKSSNIDYQSLFEDISNLQITDNENNSNKKVYRKVIIATNIAETGITIDTLKYCIDIGLVNQLEYNPYLNTNILLIKPVTQSMALQRKGRVGRKQIGSFYPLYTEKIFNNLLQIQYPDIFTDNDDKNENANDKLKKLGTIFNTDLKTLNLLDNPSDISITNSIYKLYTYGAIYANGYPTKIGMMINKIRNLSIENIKMILSGYYYNCNISDLITIAAYIQITKNKLTTSKFKSFNNQYNDILNYSKYDNYNYNKLKNRIFISCEFIDFLLFFYRFKEVVANNSDGKHSMNSNKIIQDFCDNNKINYNSLMSLIELRDEICKDFLFNMNLNPFHNNHINLLNIININKNDNKLVESILEIRKIKKCLFEGYKLNTATYNEDSDCYISDYNNSKINVESYLVKNLPKLTHGREFEIKKPKKILYNSLIIKKNNNTNNYELYSNDLISVLSGYI